MNKLRVDLRRDQSAGTRQAVARRFCSGRHEWAGTMSSVIYPTPSHSREQPNSTCALGRESRT